MYQPSFWEKESFFKDIDVCVIGSGITGLCASLFMKQKQPKLNILLVDNGFLPYGGSTRNAGFACFGSMTELMADLKNENEQEVFNRVTMRWNGLNLLRELVGDKNMDYEPLGGFEIFGVNDIQKFEEAEKQINYFNNKLFEFTDLKNTYVDAHSAIDKFKFGGVKYMIKNNYEGQINTGKMMKSLLSMAQNMGITIFSALGINSFESINNKVTIRCNNDFEFKASKCLVATNGFAKQLLPNIDVTPARAQVLVTKPIKDLPFEGAFHYDEGFYYFRNIDNRILLGGGRNLDFNAETTTNFGVTDRIQQQLERMLKEVIVPGKEVEIEMRWSGLMGLGKSKSAIVQNVGHNIFCAVRMGGMGVAIGSMIGKQAANMILDS